MCGRHRVSNKYKATSYSDISGSFTTSSCSLSSTQSKDSILKKSFSGHKKKEENGQGPSFTSEDEPLIRRKVSKSGLRKTSVIDGSPREETKLLSFSKEGSGYESIQVQEMSTSPGSESVGLLLLSKELKRKSVGSLRREFFADMSSGKSSSASIKTEDSIAKRDASGRVQVVKVSDEGIELKGMIGPIQEEQGQVMEQQPKSATSKRTALLRMSGKFKRDKLRDSLKLRPGLSVTAPPEDLVAGEGGNSTSNSGTTTTAKSDVENVSQRTSLTRRSRRRRDSSPVTTTASTALKPHSISVSPSTSSQHLLSKNPASTSAQSSSGPSSLPRTPSKRRHSTAPSLHPPPPPRSASRSPSRFGETGL